MTRFVSGSRTDVGQVRQNNQDHLLDRPDDGLFVVADGMGGHRGGEVASEVAVGALAQHFVDTADGATTDVLVGAVQEANAAVVERSRDDAELRGMGTTITALARVTFEGEDCLSVVNVGDSRAYLLKAGESDLVQITEDHSLVATLERQGQLTREEAAAHPQRNILTRALGIDTSVLVDSFELLPVKGDRYLLCSDGLFNEVEEHEIARVLREVADPSEAASMLVDMANDGGGRDNISVVVVDVVDDGGAHQLLAPRSDDHRVVHHTTGPERMGIEDPDGPRVEASATPAATAAEVADPPGPAAPAPATDAPATGGPGVAAALPSAPPAPRTRFTWRVVAFVAAFVAIVAATFLAVGWLGTRTYYVGADNGKVVIFRGRPGGVLWISPRVQEETGIAIAAVPPQYLPDVQQGKDEATIEDARQYVDNLRREIAAQAVEQERRTAAEAGGVIAGALGSSTVPPTVPVAPPATDVSPPASLPG